MNRYLALLAVLWLLCTALIYGLTTFRGSKVLREQATHLSALVDPQPRTVEADESAKLASGDASQLPGSELSVALDSKAEEEAAPEQDEGEPEQPHHHQARGHPFEESASTAEVRKRFYRMYSRVHASHLESNDRKRDAPLWYRH
mmetsp:Transcript_24652/g.61825  ORF Transcript_24652/g.61825 Transcript_24652/m.61825 type:complete len:145 (-) Transcript_24652:51-485(-)|eukprot:CAMPEP_0177658218 /NCGR_PEP_ID=MMETSP0447-20121125/16677_1 /TAXON_ID=0 /ORGANISM="Stygamoeba regulata, Strain BSH-02190019" /LENGTH=144 /DNA_ID=CAMNT_0019162777 /DNA_START=27 /DNA_END=461 /DNA_ORIENTATION=-